MKPIIIIPCYNDNNFIDILIQKISYQYDLDILVIDDGSDCVLGVDDPSAGIIVLRNEVNKGKGHSLRRAFRYAIDKNYTHAVTLDADLQHDPKYIQEFIDIDDNVDIVIGRRDFNSEMPILRRFSNKITSYIASKMTGKSILDSQSGYRRYKLGEKKYSCIEDGFQFETEILINRLKGTDERVEHVSISTVYNNEKSSINNTLDTYKFIKMILRKIFKD